MFGNHCLHEAVILFKSTILLYNGVFWDAYWSCAMSHFLYCKLLRMACASNAGWDCGCDSKELQAVVVQGSAFHCVVAQEFSCSWGLMVPYASLILMKCSIYSIDVYVYVSMCATMRSISWMQSVLVTWVRATRHGFAFAVHVSHVHRQSHRGRSAHVDVEYLMSNLHLCACKTAYFHLTRMCIVSSRPIAVPLAYYMYVGRSPIS